MEPVSSPAVAFGLAAIPEIGITVTDTASAGDPGEI
jgi:hypothetical protein